MKNSQFNQEDLLNINSNFESEYSKIREIYQSLSSMLESSVKPIEKTMSENGLLGSLHKNIEEIAKIFDSNFKNSFFGFLNNFAEVKSNDYLEIFGEKFKKNSENYYDYNDDNKIHKNYHNHIKGEASNPINLTMNINALDANSFSKSKNQIISEALLLIQRAARNF